MTTLHDPAVQDAYERGRQDAIDEFTRCHLDRIGDILDAIDQHAGDVEQLRIRIRILRAMGHDAP
ncbi:hypothetical protein GCM10010399_44150 [Dactylosporangium fulvum]|uniref:Uncharacterized protein n=1 Tax=Dactylosporangium fulvum TaxID=53359 RepID=A0ABY5WB49_9ACTN|nr:hypothetical protein [Dactylosporangium fulvum]UWP85918.1 hypothetical protein Dfulv_17365 [Dactylosporangium fulvum]